MSYQQKKDDVWEKSRKIHGKDPGLYINNKLGNIMYKPSYGKNSPMGWEIDHSIPQSKGGTDHLNNLQVLNTTANRHKGNKKI